MRSTGLGKGALPEDRVGSLDGRRLRLWARRTPSEIFYFTARIRCWWGLPFNIPDV